MSDAAVRRASLVMASMHPGVRSALLASLAPELRDRVQSALREVVAQGWQSRTRALELLAEESLEQQIDDVALPPVFLLADQLTASGLACVLQAAGMNEDDFLLSLLETPVSAAVRQSMRQRSVMLPAVREATQAAAEHLLATRAGVG